MLLIDPMQQKREKSDYDDFYLASKEETIEQVKNTRSVIEAIREFIEKLDV